MAPAVSGAGQGALSLGVFPDVSLKEARERRDQARRDLAKGIDPGAKRRTEKLASADTFEAIAREWFEKFSTHWALGYSSKVIRRLEICVFPWIGSTPIGQIKPPDLLACIRRVEGRGKLGTAHRALQVCGRVFRYAVATGRAERDPSGDLRGALPPKQEKHHASFTDPKSLTGLLRAIDAYEGSRVVRNALRWRQSAPYGNSVGDGEFGILIQNSGRQASVISIVAGLRKTHGTLAQARQSRAWSGVVSKTERIIEEMPLWRLQLLRAEPLEFLYVRSEAEGNIRLKAGVAANLRRFHGMVLRLAQSEWLRFIQALPGNASLLGATSDLGQFLFGAERSALNRMVEPLREAQHGCCLYCERQVVTGEIDHFVPWSRYQRDLAHNLVLAHVVCNRKKSDLLADERHLERWIGRNRDRDAIIVQAGGEAGLMVDLPTTLGVARWAYAQGDHLRAGVWSRDDDIAPLSGQWRSLLGS